MIKKKILVVGHPRSGTGYMFKLLRHYGFSIGHEHMGSDGMSSWTFATNSKRHPCGSQICRDNYEFEHIIHVVRNPIKVIASTAYTVFNYKKFSAYIARFVPLNLKADAINQATQSYVGWNTLIEESLDISLRIQIENCETEILKHLIKGGELINKTGKTPQKNYNSRKHPEITIDEISKSLRPELLEIAEKYGYDLENTQSLHSG